MNIRELVSRFANDESGLETVEYAIVGGLLAAATVLTIGSIGDWVSAAYTAVVSHLGTAPT